jgi:hypothetical protein
MNLNLELKLRINQENNNNNNNNPLILFAPNQSLGDMGIMEIIDCRANLALLETKNRDIHAQYRIVPILDITENLSFSVILTVNNRISRRTIIITTTNEIFKYPLHPTGVQVNGVCGGANDPLIKEHGGRKYERRTERKEWRRQ